MFIIQPCFLLVKPLFTTEMQSIFRVTAICRKPGDLLKMLLKKTQQTKSGETIGVPIYYGMNMTHRSSHQTDLYFPKLSHRARLHRLLLNELPLSGWEHKNLAFQTKLFQLTVL